MSYLSDITHRLLAARQLGRVNTGIDKTKGTSTGNPYGIPSDFPLPPEAYGTSGPPPGYTTYTGETGTSPVMVDPNSLPPAATGVRPGPAYPDYSGEPMVIVNQPYVEPDLPAPEPYTPPDWIMPPPAGSTPPEAILGDPAGDWAQRVARSAPVPTAGYPYYDPEVENAMIGSLVNWNGPGLTNIHDPENSQGGALAARFGLMGVQGGGIDWRKRSK